MIKTILPAYLYQQYASTAEQVVQTPAQSGVAGYGVAGQAIAGQPIVTETTSYIQSFFTAYNNTSQTYLDNINQLNLPVYTNLIAPLLDWVATSLYGLERPSLGAGITANVLSVYDTTPYNTVPYSSSTYSNGSTIYLVNDDYYKRILTWNFYRGDGYQYNTDWLKRRVKRFLYGVNGISPNIQNTYEISVTYTSGSAITITIPNVSASPIFSSAVAAGVLSLPFQYTYTVVY